MFENKFYKMHLNAEESGLTVWTEIFLSIHETPCFHICIREREKGFFAHLLNSQDEPPIKYAKRKKIKTFRIHKEDSRIAFNTLEKAFGNLRYLKGLQSRHLLRQLEFNNAFIENTKNKIFDELTDDRLRWPPGAIGVPSKSIEGTQNLIRRHFVFD